MQLATNGNRRGKERAAEFSVNSASVVVWTSKNTHHTL